MNTGSNELSWRWLGRHAVAILVAMILATALGDLELFRQTTLGTTRLNASSAVEFLGFGGALALFWWTGHRAAQILSGGSARLVATGQIVTPLVTLVSLCAAYQVMLTILRPFMESTARNVYNWTFVLAITAAALWLFFSLFRHSEALLARSDSRKPAGTRAEKRCRSCGATVSSGDRFCHACGKSVY
jgi:hypothetical protein